MDVKSIKYLDKYLGAPLCYFFGLLKLRPLLKQPKRILLIQLWGIGESVLTLPTLTALKAHFPEAKLDILVTGRNRQVYEDHPALNKVHEIPLSARGILRFMLKHSKRYDLAVDFEEYLNVSALIAYMTAKYRVGYAHGARSTIYHRHVSYNDRQHCLQTFLDLARSLGAEAKGQGESLPYSDADKKTVDRIMGQHGITASARFICIAPGAAESAKCRMWPAERYAELCDHLLDLYRMPIVLSGTEEETDLIDSIREKVEDKKRLVSLAGKLSLPQLFYLLKRCTLFIGNDSGPMHIAAAQGAKTIGLFGPNLPVRFGPYGKKTASVYKGEICEFSPCINVHKGETPDCLYPRDSKDYQKCMKNISVGEVVDEVGRMLG